MSDSKLDTMILERLDQILRVLGLQVAMTLADRSLTERARLLKMAGLDNQMIADILNTNPASIRALTTHLRKGSKKGG